MEDKITEENKTEITINDVPYALEDMTDKQKELVSHVVDLDTKISSHKFGLNQLEFSKVAFMDALVEELKEDS